MSVENPYVKTSNASLRPGGLFLTVTFPWCNYSLFDALLYPQNVVSFNGMNVCVRRADVRMAARRGTARVEGYSCSALVSVARASDVKTTISYQTDQNSVYAVVKLTFAKAGHFIRMQRCVSSFYVYYDLCCHVQDAATES